MIVPRLHSDCLIPAEGMSFWHTLGVLARAKTSQANSRQAISGFFCETTAWIECRYVS